MKGACFWFYILEKAKNQTYKPFSSINEKGLHVVNGDTLSPKKEISRPPKADI